MLNRQDNNQTMQEKMTWFEQSCKAAGLKLTHQRLEIFRELAEAKDHPSAETLYKRLKRRMPTISLDTIYRTLTSLEHYGLITRVHTVESQARFEAEKRVHHHLICEKCKEIMDFQWQMFDDSVLPGELSHWGRIRLKNATVLGICAKCLQTGKKGQTE